MKNFTPDFKISLLLWVTLTISASLNAQSYCAARGGLCTTADNSWINSLTFDVFTNSSACATTGYTDMTSTVISVVRGSNYSISISEDGTTGTDVAGAWIDWNKDGDLEDPDEIIAMSGTGLTPFTGNVLVPTGALLGSTRMRIRVLFAPDGPAAACGNTTYGEVEDYTINVLSCSPGPGTIGTIGGQTSICSGTVNTYSIAAVTGASSYTWTVPAGMTITSGQGSTSINLSGTASGTISVTAGNSCGNSAPKTKAITIKSNPTASAGSDVSFCEGGSAQLSGGGGANYSWSPATGLDDATIATPLASPVTPTTYTVTVTGSNGCTATDAVMVDVQPAPLADAGTDVSICSGGSTQLNASGGAGYSWSSSAGLSDPTIADPIAMPASTMSYTVAVTGSNGCTSSDEVMVTVNSLPAAGAGNDATICSGGSTTLNGTGGSSYSWSPTTGLSCSNCASPVATPANNITYTVTVTNADGCTAKDAVSVLVSSSITASAGSDVSICSGNSSNLTASGGSTYSWAPSTGLSCTNCANPAANPMSTITYTVTVSSGSCAPDADEITVTVKPTPVANAGPDVMVCQGYGTQLGASGGVSYNWMPPTGLSNAAIANPMATPGATITYTVVVGSADGCYNHDEMTVTVDPCLGVAATYAEETVELVPNPSTGIFNVKVSGSVLVYVDVMDMNGRVVYSANNNTPSDGMIIDISSLNGGLYFLKIKMKDGEVISKMMKE